MNFLEELLKNITELSNEFLNAEEVGQLSRDFLDQ